MMVVVCVSEVPASERGSTDRQRWEDGELQFGGSKACNSGRENKGMARRRAVACSHSGGGVVVAGQLADRR
jgi:hypothetical protein